MQPNGWSRKRVADLGEVVAGKAKNVRSAEPLRPYLRVANVFDGRIDTSDVLEMPFSEAEFARYELSPGDVLLNEGQSLDLVGRCSIYRGELPRPCAIQNALLRFRAGPEANSFFMEQLFRWCQRSGVFARISTQTTSIAHLGVKRLANLEVLVPGLPEQRKIAAILSSVDEVIERTEAVIEQLQVVKKAMMQELLTRGLPGRHTRFKQTEIGEIPEEWEVASLGDVLEGIDAGWSPKCESAPVGSGEWGVLKVSSVTWGRFDAGENKRLPDHLEPRPDIEVRPGDLVISRANTPALVGRSAVAGEVPPRLMLSDKLLRLRVSEETSSDFVNLVLATPHSRRIIEEGSTGTSKSMRNISQEKLRALSVLLPTRKEQDEIVAAFRLVDRRVDAEGVALKALTSSKAALMSVLLTGQLRVTPDEEAAA